MLGRGGAEPQWTFGSAADREPSPIVRGVFRAGRESERSGFVVANPDCGTTDAVAAAGIDDPAMQTRPHLQLYEQPFVERRSFPHHGHETPGLDPDPQGAIEVMDLEHTVVLGLVHRGNGAGRLRLDEHADRRSDGFASGRDNLTTQRPGARLAGPGENAEAHQSVDITVRDVRVHRSHSIQCVVGQPPGPLACVRGRR